MNKKVFLITVDTEEDNQWEYSDIFTTENVKYLPRFQELCEKYEYKPTWLTSYVMTQNNDFVDYFSKKQYSGNCEIGMHLHAWNCPPYVNINKKTKERPYITEYSNDIVEMKVKEITKAIIDKFGERPISHRSGRWALNDNYLKILSEYGYKIDCSVTPHINWSKNLGATGIKGTNYYDYNENAYFINGNMIELPVTIRKDHSFQIEKIKSVKDLIVEIRNYVFGRFQWVRPDYGLSFKGIKSIMNKCNKNNDYIMFMIHSSELMPGGSPYFKTSDKIEKLYDLVENIFRYAKELSYEGMTLKEYYNNYK